MVLNKKKAKIRGLQDALRQLQQTHEQQRDEEGRQRSARCDFLYVFNNVAEMSTFATYWNFLVITHVQAQGNKMQLLQVIIQICCLSLPWSKNTDLSAAQANFYIEFVYKSVF